MIRRRINRQCRNISQGAETFKKKGVLCESVGPGMRHSERAVTVRAVQGQREVILTECDLLAIRGDKSCLAVGICFIDKERDVVLVEFPHEAITGGNRLWVRSDDLIWPNGAKP